jgi:hypothetical protein
MRPLKKAKMMENLSSSLKAIKKIRIVIMSTREFKGKSKYRIKIYSG